MSLNEGMNETFNERYIVEARLIDTHGNVSRQIINSDKLHQLILLSFFFYVRAINYYRFSKSIYLPQTE